MVHGNRLRHLIAPYRVTGHIESLFIWAAENIATGVTARHLCPMDGLDLDDLSLTIGDPILQHTHIFHARELQIIGVLPVDSVNRNVLIQFFTAFAIETQANVVQMNMAAQIGIYIPINSRNRHGQRLHGAHNPFLLGIDRFPGSAVVDHIFLARVPSPIHGNDHRKQPKATCHILGRQPGINEKCFTVVSDFNGCIADLLKLHSSSPPCLFLL